MGDILSIPDDTCMWHILIMSVIWHVDYMYHICDIHIMHVIFDVLSPIGCMCDIEDIYLLLHFTSLLLIKDKSE